MMTHVIIGTAGHIDHGKSSLVLALTGTDPDRLQEEKARGITIDLGFAHTTHGDTVLSFVDVPGHERFVKNMLAGVGGIDLIMLHVAADESVMPQTREHFDICRLLRVPAGLVVLTKADLVDAETLDVVRLEVQELVAGSFLQHAPVVAVSSKTGAGLDQLRATLVELAGRGAGRPVDAPARLPIDRVFSVRGFGTVVTGTLVAGRVAVDDELVLVPSGRPVKVRGLQVYGAARRDAAAGQRVAANLAGVEVGDIARGETLAAPGAVTVTRQVEAMVELLVSARPLRHGARVRFHHGTRELHGRVSLPEASLDPGREGLARIRFDAPATLVRGDRFILRAASPVVTVGGGVVLDPQPLRRGIRTPAAAQRMPHLAPASPAADVVACMVGDAGLQGLPLVHLASRAGLTGRAQQDLLSRWQQTQEIVAIGDVLVSRAKLDAAERQVLSLVGEHHAGHPLEEGIPREELRARLFSNAALGVFDYVVNALARGGHVLARERVALRGHTLALTDEEAAARDRVVQVLADCGLAPPDRAELMVRVGARKEVADRVVHLLVRQKQLVRLGDLLFHPDALQRLKDDVQARKGEAAGRIDVGTFKERYQVTRKYAIPLLEFLDRERVTRRVGDVRVIL